MSRSRGRSPGELEPARTALESVSDDTTTADCHPVILDDAEDETERLVGNDASSSGLVAKLAPRTPTVVDPDAETETRKAIDRAEYERQVSETATAIPGDISGALETVPLSAALVQQVLAKVDARRAAAPPPMAMPMPLPAPPPAPPAPKRRIGVEIAIAIAAFLAVAVPAFYWLYVSR